MPEPLYKLIACDLDDTLAETKQPIDQSVAVLIEQLISKHDFCIITGGTFAQIEQNVLKRISANTTQDLSRLHAMSTSGATYHRYNPTQKKWSVVYSKKLPEEERIYIVREVERIVRELGLWEPEPYGEIIQDRGSQITFSALGQLASPAAKRAWDPDRVKRNKLRNEIARVLPVYEVVINGNTSVDVLKKGIDKGYGIKKLMEYCQLSPGEVIFYGDSLLPGGNDFPVIGVGVKTVHVKNVSETKQHLTELLIRQKSGSV